MRIVVTGAAGFIGFHLSRALLAAGHTVDGIDSFNSYYDPALKEARVALLASLPGWRLHRRDFAAEGTVAEVFAQAEPEIVVHLGAQAGVRYSVENPSAYLESNLRGFLEVLEGCRRQRVRHLIFASSSTVYGANASVPFRESDATDTPVSFYGATKKANEVMAHTYAHLHGLPATGLRFFTVYGPWGRPDLGVYVFADALADGRELVLYNHGRNERDFTYIDDVVEGLLRLLDRPPAPGSGWVAGRTIAAPFTLYNIGNHQPVSVLECVETLARALGRPARYRLAPAQPGDMAATYADTTRLREAVGFAPRTPFADGIERFCRWYTSHRGLLPRN